MHPVMLTRDQAVAGPLGEETKGDEDNKTASVADCLEQFHPSVALEFLL